MVLTSEKKEIGNAGLSKENILKGLNLSNEAYSTTGISSGSLLRLLDWTETGLGWATYLLDFLPCGNGRFTTPSNCLITFLVHKTLYFLFLLWLLTLEQFLQRKEGINRHRRTEQTKTIGLDPFKQNRSFFSLSASASSVRERFKLLFTNGLIDLGFSGSMYT